MICWLVIMIGWVGGAALLYTPPASATRQTPSRVAPAGPVPAQSDGTVTDVIVNGAANDIEISGHCVTLTVSGSSNTVLPG